MKIKKTLLITIVLLAILSLGAVNAQDNGTDDVTSSGQDNTIQSINEDSKLSDDASTAYNKTVYVETAEGSDAGAGSEASPYKTINKAISDVNPSDKAVIYLASGNYTGENNTNLQINLNHKNNNGSLTFIGDSNGGTIIDGNNTSPIFKLIGANSIVTFINITFTHGKSETGSAVTSNGALTIDNCVFRENYVTGYGAVDSERGDLTVINSKFYKNSGRQYVDLYFSHEALLTLVNNVFEGSTSTYTDAYTPAVYICYAKSVIKQNTFRNLTSSYNAAALMVRYNNGDYIANITDNTFINCTYTGQSGGILFFENAYLKGNNFINCTTKTTLLYSSTDFNARVEFESINVDGTSFDLKANVTDDMGNKVYHAKVIFYIDDEKVGTATSDATGVATLPMKKLLDNGKHTISGTQAYDNTNHFNVTVINGSATVDFDHTPVDVWVSSEGNDDTGDGSETNPFLTLKKALDYGTGATVDLRVHIENGIYKESKNRDLSYSHIGKVTIIGESYGNVIIDAEHASKGSGWYTEGLNIFKFGQQVEIELVNLTLINCDGYPVDAYALTMKDNIVINSSTIRSQSPNNGVYIDNLKIINGTTQAINAYNLVLTNSVIENCNGKTSTGLLWLSNSNGFKVRLENNTFKGNTIEGYSGGAAYYAQCDLVSINNTFDSNTATGTTDYIVYARGNHITSINDKFINNKVGSYIAQFISSGNNAAEIIVENITFINNTASEDCAGLSTNGAKIKGGKFINNTAGGNGGAIYLTKHYDNAKVCEISIEDVTFENNVASIGNDIFIEQSQGTDKIAVLKDLTITANSKNVTELSDILTVTVSHPSGAIIGGGQVTFYLDGFEIGKADLINQNATWEYIGFKNNTEYQFTSIYEYATENYTYVNGVISTNIADALDSIELYVSDSLGDDEKGNGSENNPFKSISKALSEGYAKSTNITVHVLKGNYTGELNTNLRIPTTVDVLLVGEDADKVNISDSAADYFITALPGKSKLTLANVTLNRAARDTQSAIYVEKGANVEIDNVIFINGQGNYGGAINTAGTLVVNNSYFFDNGYGDVSKRTNAICGGAIYNDGILIIDNTTFEANHASRLSTIASQGTLYMKNSQVIDSISCYSNNMDLVAIGAFGGQYGNITIENSILTVTNRTVNELSNRIYVPGNSFTCLAIGSCEHATIINSTFENKGAIYSPIVFGGINSWNLMGGGYTIVPGDIEVYNSTFRNLQAVSLFYTRNDGSLYYSHRLFDGCLFENVEYIIAALNSGNFSVEIHNSVILSNDTAIIGIASGKTLEMNVSNNWWGSNNATFKNATIGTSNFISNYVLKLREISSEVVNPENYLVLTLNQTGNDVELAFKSFDGENLTDYDRSLPAREFTINATGAVLGISNGTIANKISIPVSPEASIYTIEATADNQTVNLTVEIKNTKIDIVSVNEDSSINATLTDSEGKPVKNAIVSYEIGNIKANVTTDENGNFNIPCVANGDALIKFEGNIDYYTSNKTFKFNGAYKPESPKANITIPDVKPGENATIDVKLPENATGNVTVKVDGEIIATVPVVNGTASIALDNLTPGAHFIETSYSGDDNYGPVSNAKAITVEAPPELIKTIVFAPTVKTTYNGNGYLTVTVKDENGKAVKSASVNITLNGKTKVVKTDSKGVAKLSTNGLKPNTYTANIVFNGDSTYAKSSINTKVVVNKAKSKITAKKKTFKKSKKVKKFTITLKSGKKAIKKVKVTIKIGKKTFKAKTNAKGKATFKIKKFSKKNKYIAVVKFKGNKYYKKSSKLVIIKIK